MARVDRRICFTICQKQIPCGVRSLKVTTRHLNTPAAAMNTPLAKCHASLGASQYSAELAKHTHMAYIELDGGMPAGRGSREGARKDGGWERGSKGRVGGIDDVRQGWSGSGGKEG